ncbi:MAG: tRNA dihydrouridine(20/20a) synthase DusA [Hyphomicrobiales bacterium]
MNKYQPHKFSIAPMMDWTDRHCRFFHRLMTRHALLYTEMVTTGAVIHGDREHLLGFSGEEHPVALQIGGSDPGECAQAAQIGEQFGYDEINLNVGCPSDRVQSGRFGACLMAEPATVADCVAEIKSAVSIPVTVKSRIGIDDQDEDEDLDKFIDTVAAAGCERFIVHARKAWLSGLSPKENRDVPPLNYGRVQRLAARRSDLEIVINGGICDLDLATELSEDLSGVMLGRAAYQDPWILSEVDEVFFGTENAAISRYEVVEKMTEYAKCALSGGAQLKHIARHILGLYQGKPGARAWRRCLSENMHKDDAGPELLLQAANLLSEQAEAA